MINSEERVVSTKEMLELLNSGKKVEIVGIESNPELFENYTEEEKKFVEDHRVGLRVDNIEYDCDEEVQCIMVDSDDHLYLTDDMIPTHNTSNVIFLKSTDDSMIDTLSKMSGTTHRVRIKSKTVATDLKKMWMKNEGTVSYTPSVEEEPVITPNDMFFIGERNSMVFRAGCSPIWNKNATILPMSFKLFGNKIIHFGHDYSLQTIPTLSVAKDFDVTQNQINFDAMIAKRMEQSLEAEDSIELYKKLFGLNEYTFSLINQEDRSNDIMNLINLQCRENNELAENADMETQEDVYYNKMVETEENTEVTQEMYKRLEKSNARKIPRFANNTVSPADLVDDGGGINFGLKDRICRAFEACRPKMEADIEHFKMDGKNLCGLDGTPYIIWRDNSDIANALVEQSKKADSTTYVEDKKELEKVPKFNYDVQSAFIKFLANCEKWDFADGEFDHQMAQLVDVV